MSQPQVSPAWASTAVEDLLGGQRQQATVFAACAAASYLSLPPSGTSPEVLAPLSPGAVRLPIGVVLAERGLPEPGSAVVVGEGSIAAGNNTWCPTRWWDPRPHLPAQQLLANSARLLELVESRPASSFGLGLGDALTVAGALAGGDVGPALGVIGLGPGLTPAADDAVAGALAMLALVGRLERHLVAQIEGHASSRTTALSAALLKAASRGQVIPQVVGVLGALAAGGSTDRLEQAAAELFAVGATSGYALCAGMAGALCASAEMHVFNGGRARHDEEESAMSPRVELRRGVYRDSVVLMQVSQAVAACKGVTAALVAMATPLNLEIYGRLGFDPDAVEGATPNDLLVAIAADDDALEAATAELENRLAPPASSEQRGWGSPPAPRTVVSALRHGGSFVPSSRCRDSTPSSRRWTRSAFRRVGNALFRQRVGRTRDRPQRRGRPARRARHGSRLRHRRRRRSRRSASRTRSGRVLSASWPLREPVPSRSPACSTPTTSALRRFSASVAGIFPRLSADGRRWRPCGRSTSTPGTEFVVVLSKPPDPDVAERMRTAASGLRTPSIVAFVARGQDDLTAATARILTALGHERDATAGMARPLRPVRPARLHPGPVLGRDPVRRGHGDRGRTLSARSRPTLPWSLPGASART